jgi:glucose/arabinose dehydrogenase
MIKAYYRFIVLSLVIIILIIFGIDTVDIVALAQPTVKDPNLKVDVFAQGLNSPTSMTFLDSTHILVLEKETGAVRLIVNGQLQNQPILTVPINTENERGLLGIVSTADTTTTTTNNKFVFLYYTEANNNINSELRNRIYRYQWNGINLINPVLILDLPAIPGPNHDGGKMVIGSQDHYLYAVIGDLNHRGQLQNIKDGPPPDNTSVILRINPLDGSPAKNNPFVNTSNNNSGNNNNNGGKSSTLMDSSRYYYAYGIRNSFGLAFDPILHNLWDTENGPGEYDEINLVKPGFNSGWIKVMGPITQSGISSGENQLVNLPGSKYLDPVFSWKAPVAVTGIEFLNSSKLGNRYKDNVFVGDYNNGNLYFFELNNTRTGFNFNNSNQLKLQQQQAGLTDLVVDNDQEESQVTFGSGFGSITDIKTGPADGYLYIVSISDGIIYRILPVDSMRP